jgi:ethanolamine utilization protein EutA
MPAGDPQAEPAHSHLDLENATRLRSIGIDIGSATSHFSVSELYVGRANPLMATRPQVLHRHLLYQSPIVLTPFSTDTTIDAAALEDFLTDECARAEIDLASMDTGVVICTGEAARRENARAISERLAERSGKFVCASAGHHLEALLGAYGSGAVDLSRRSARPLVVLDVGGGTAKRTLIVGGQVLHTAALNVGARLVARGPDLRISRIEAAGRRIAAGAGLALELGDLANDVSCRQLATRMSRSLAQFLQLAACDDVTRELLLTTVSPLPEGYDLLIVGGLAEYFYGRQTGDFGDLGMFLSSALSAELAATFETGSILEPRQGIRATVIGAGQFSVQVSGDTLYLDGGLRPPIRGVPVRTVLLDWTSITTEGVRSLLAAATGSPADEMFAFAFPEAPLYGYGAAIELGQALAAVLPELPLATGVILIFGHNIARTVGTTLGAARVPMPFMCIDELHVGDLDFIDVGPSVPGEDTLPVVVRSLIFSGPAHRSHRHADG